MKRYRKRPLIIEAIQFVETKRTRRRFGDSVEYNSGEIADFTGLMVFTRFEPSKDPKGRVSLEINTGDDVIRVNLNDYVIRGIKGEIYACSPDVFVATYEEVADLERGKFL